MNNPLLSITRLQLRSYWRIPGFIFSAGPIINQAKVSPGFIAVKTIFDRKRVFWTVTLWKDLGSMQKFMGSGPHLQSMPLLRTWCSFAAVTYLPWSSSELPSVDECLKVLKAQPKYTSLAHPSAEHLEKSLPDTVRPWTESSFG